MSSLAVHFFSILHFFIFLFFFLFFLVFFFKKISFFPFFHSFHFFIFLHFLFFIFLHFFIFYLRKSPLPSSVSPDPRPGELLCCTDADKTSRRSTSGCVVTLGGGVLNCWAMKQKSVALSSWERELFAAITSGTGSSGIQSELMDLGYKCSVTVATDSQSVVDHSKRHFHLFFFDIFRFFFFSFFSPPWGLSLKHRFFLRNFFSLRHDSG